MKNAKAASLHELPVPTLGASEVLIALHTAGVGPWDADIRQGWLPEGRADFPLVLGTDGAGTVAAVGPNVSALAVGDSVFSYSWANPKGPTGASSSVWHALRKRRTSRCRSRRPIRSPRRPKRTSI